MVSPFPADWYFEVPILQVESFNAAGAITSVQGGVFSWPNTVDQQVNSAIYGNNVCGPMSYRLTQINPPMATLNPDFSVTVRPLKDIHTPQVYTFYLVGTLIDYNKVDSTPFTVNVIACKAVVDASAFILPPLSNTWYNSPTFIEIASNQPSVVQTPDCCHPLRYEAYFDDGFGNPSVNRLPDFGTISNSEVAFENNTFRIKKCDPLGQPITGDSMCNDSTEPFRIQYTIWMKITLDDAFGDQWDFAPAVVTIEDPCVNDQLGLTDTQLVFDYYLRTPSVTIPYAPKLI